jgi:XTP/dITP diphosphohydrolase
LPGIRWRWLAEFPSLPAIPERGRTFRANAIAKARAVARLTGQLAIADDSGLEVHALDGAPGVRSARFAGRQGDDHANTAKLLRLLDGLPASRRGARFRCVLALASPTKLLAVTEGVWEGRMTSAPRGRQGFGYDPVFLIPQLGKTAAELPSAAKNRLSHRGRAASRMRALVRRLAQ